MGVDFDRDQLPIVDRLVDMSEPPLPHQTLQHPRLVRDVRPGGHTRLTGFPATTAAAAAAAAAGFPEPVPRVVQDHHGGPCG